MVLRGVTRVDLRYEAPETLQAAVALLAGATGPAKILAGGTDVIVQMETDLIEPSLLVDIKKIPELRQITSENGGFRIGAAVPGMEIMGHAALVKAWPGVLDGVKLTTGVSYTFELGRNRTLAAGASIKFSVYCSPSGQPIQRHARAISPASSSATGSSLHKT